MSDLKIAIIGAGPVGCTLARLLLNASVDVTVFEGEASANFRTQGGTLDLHNATGLAALKKAGLYDEFFKHARFDGEAITIANKKMRRFVSFGGTSSTTSRGRPEIDRKALRDLLVKSLPDGIVKWNHRLRNIDDDMTLYFDHATESGFDLVIGADGTWSKVRPLTTSIKPFFSGVHGIRLGIDDVANKYPDLYKLVNRGSLFTYSDNKGVTAQQLGDGSIIISVILVKAEEWIKQSSLDFMDMSAVKKYLLEELHDWAPELRKFIEVADMETWASPLYMLPVGHRWVHRPGVTLVGDAAHVMTPFAGEGVNLGMKDTMVLADAIINTQRSGMKENLTPNIKAYEADMFVRMERAGQLTVDLMRDIYFTEGAPDSNIESYICHAAGGELPWFALPVFRAMASGYFGFCRWWWP